VSGLVRIGARIRKPVSVTPGYEWGAPDDRITAMGPVIWQGFEGNEHKTIYAGDSINSNEPRRKMET